MNASCFSPFLVSFLFGSPSSPRAMQSCCFLARCLHIRLHGEPWNLPPQIRPQTATETLECQFTHQNQSTLVCKRIYAPTFVYGDNQIYLLYSFIVALEQIIQILANTLCHVIEVIQIQLPVEFTRNGQFVNIYVRTYQTWFN